MFYVYLLDCFDIYGMFDSEAAAYHWAWEVRRFSTFQITRDKPSQFSLIHKPW